MKNSIIRKLRALESLNVLGDEEIESLAELGRVETVPKDRLLIHDNTEGDKLYILLEGALRVFRMKDDLHYVDVADLAPGAVLGELAMLTEGKRTANVIALCDCAVYYISSDEFKTHISLFSGFSALIAQQIAARFIDFSKKSAEAPPIDVFENLLNILRSLSSVSSIGGRDEFYISGRLPIKKLAAELGVTPAEVRRMLAKLEAEGAIVNTGGRLILKLVQ